jgi:hypothetical protein
MLTDLNDPDAEVRREQRPHGSPSVALLEAAHGEHGLFAVSPAHAGAFQPLGSERLARRFDVSTIIRSSRHFFSHSCDIGDLLSLD